jgi:hypothetical protein
LGAVSEAATIKHQCMGAASMNGNDKPNHRRRRLLAVLTVFLDVPATIAVGYSGYVLFSMVNERVDEAEEQWEANENPP